MVCYYTTTWQKDFLLISTTLGGIFLYSLNVSRCMDCHPTTIGKDFVFFKFKQLYGLLLHLAKVLWF